MACAIDDGQATPNQACLQKQSVRSPENSGRIPSIQQDRRAFGAVISTRLRGEAHRRMTETGM